MAQSPFLDSIRRFMLVRGYSRRTIDAYLYWIKRFILYHSKAHPSNMGVNEVSVFLTYLDHIVVSIVIDHQHRKYLEKG